MSLTLLKSFFRILFRTSVDRAKEEANRRIDHTDKLSARDKADLKAVVDEATEEAVGDVLDTIDEIGEKGD